MRFFARFIALSLLALLLLSPSVFLGHAAENPKYGGSIALAVSEIATQGGFTTWSTAGNYVIVGPLMDSLVVEDVDLNYHPNLAQSWTISADGKAWTFHLVNNATWHDGQQFTSADVKFSINLTRTLHPLGPTFFGHITNIQTPDNFTVILTLDAPQATLLTGLSQFTGKMVPKHILQGVADPNKSTFVEHPIGTGPFKFVEWVKGSHITLVRNEHYWRTGRPFLDKIVFNIILEPSARVAALEAGDLDGLTTEYIPLSDAQRLSNDSRFFVQTQSAKLAASTDIIYFNLNQKPFDDARVRKAISFAIDRQALSTIIYSGFASPVCTPFPYAPFTDPTIQCGYDPVKAGQLLDDAGYNKGSDGVRFQFEASEIDFSTFVPTSELLKAQLAKVGVVMNIKIYDFDTWLTRLFTNYNFSMVFSTLSYYGGDPNLASARYLTSQSIHKGVPFDNVMRYSNPTVDRLFNASAQELDLNKRIVDLQMIQQTLDQDQPVAWLTVTRDPSIYSKNFAGIPQGPWIDSENWANVWWKKGSDVSPDLVRKTIDQSKNTVQSLASQLYDISQAQQLINQSEAALARGAYATAYTLANQAPGAAKPNYPIYGAIIAVIVVVLAGLVLYRRSRR